MTASLPRIVTCPVCGETRPIWSNVAKVRRCRACAVKDRKPRPRGWRKWTPSREQRAAYNANAKARELGIPGTITAAGLRARLEFWGWKCHRCGGPFEAIDHVIPFHEGGLNFHANIRPSCTRCNSQWAARSDFHPTRGLRRPTCKKGHPMTEDNIVMVSGGRLRPGPYRRCKICRIAGKRGRP